MRLLREVGIAPMMGWTNRHFLYLMRLISPNTRQYFEMLVDDTILHQHARLPRIYGPYSPQVIPQIGGSSPSKLAESVLLLQALGYREINLNVGCPSSKVQNGCFGAVLMKSPLLVGEIVSKIKATCPGLTMSVKCRIGVDEFEDFSFLFDFVSLIFVLQIQGS